MILQHDPLSSFLLPPHPDPPPHPPPPPSHHHHHHHHFPIKILINRRPITIWRTPSHPSYPMSVTPLARLALSLPQACWVLEGPPEYHLGGAAHAMGCVP